MRHLEQETHYDAPIERVFDLATDPSRISEMMPWLRVRDVKGRGDAVGDSFKFEDEVLGQKRRGTTVVRAVERPTHQTTESLYEDGSRATWEMSFTSVGDGTDAHDRVTYDLAGVLGGLEETILGPLIRRRLEEGGERFRAMLATPPAAMAGTASGASGEEHA